MRFLVERVLLEDIAAVKKYYPNIEDSVFMDLIKQDPTYKENSNNVGKYGKWILNLYNKNKLDNIGHLKDILIRFEENRKQLKDKDIGKFKSLEDLDAYLNDQSNYNQLSDRQELRQVQKKVHNTDVEQDANIVFEDEDWIVYVPKTYEASCKLGANTKWCTASTANDHYYKYYTNKGPLFININKHNPSEKYQFHFETDSFMDKEDKGISIELFFINNSNLFEFYKDKLSEETARNVPIVKKFITNNPSHTFLYDGTPIPMSICRYIEHINITDNLKEIGSHAFERCTSLTSITIPDNITSIGYKAFAGCDNLKSIVIPEGVTHIDKNAFYHCYSLTNVTLPNSIIDMSDDVFFDCYELHYNVYNNAKYLGNKTNKYLYLAKAIDTSIVDCEIYSGTKIIGSDAFDSCKNLKSIVIPDSVTNIGSSAFEDCSSLTNITLSNSVTNIGSRVFYGCDSLTNIIIPNGVKSIEYRMFADCDSLTNIVIPNNVKSIGDSAFSGCTSLINVTMENGVSTIGSYAFSDCRNLKSITLPESITKVDYYAFDSCNKLTKIICKSKNLSIENHWGFESNVCTLYCYPDSNIVKNKDDYRYSKLKINVKTMREPQEESLSVKEALEKLKKIN